MMKRNDKKGEVSIGVIIGIVLGAVVLVLMIFGFRNGWFGFLGKTDAYLGDSNVQQVIDSCISACELNKQYDWCSNNRTVNLGNEKVLVDGKQSSSFTSTCAQLSTRSGGKASVSCSITC